MNGLAGAEVMTTVYFNKVHLTPAANCKPELCGWRGGRDRA